MWMEGRGGEMAEGTGEGREGREEKEGGEGEGRGQGW